VNKILVSQKKRPQLSCGRFHFEDNSLPGREGMPKFNAQLELGLGWGNTATEPLAVAKPDSSEKSSRRHRLPSAAISPHVLAHYIRTQP